MGNAASSVGVRLEVGAEPEGDPLTAVTDSEPVVSVVEEMEVDRMREKESVTSLLGVGEKPESVKLSVVGIVRVGDRFRTSLPFGRAGLPVKS